MDIDTADLENKIRQRIQSAKNPLLTIPDTNRPKANIPNTPAASAIIAFCLGGVFALGLYTAVNDIVSGQIRVPYQLALYISAWGFFHWAEFTVTALWNLEKCCVDCEFCFIYVPLCCNHAFSAYLLENGSLYHIAHCTAILEYSISRYFIPSYKSFPYISQVGLAMVVLGQMLRSVAMIHASSNFSHAVAFYKRLDHKLVTDGVYGCCFPQDCPVTLLTIDALAGFAILLMRDSSIGRLVPSFSCRILSA